MDLTEGIIARFRTMHIARASVLTGHVLGSLIQAAFSLVIVTGVALLVGFRPVAGPGAWLAAAGFLLVVTFALVWLAVAFGQVSKSVETASNLPMPLILLPFLADLDRRDRRRRVRLVEAPVRPVLHRAEATQLAGPGPGRCHGSRRTTSD